MFLVAIIALSILIFVHEFGHFIMAKLVGVKVTEFSLGFGPKIFQRQRGETTYGLGIVPAGGYVKLAGMWSEEPEGFILQPIWKRISVVVAGPVMNFILGAIFFWLVFLAIGVPFYPATVAGVQKNSPAYQVGIKAGDEILAINGKMVARADDVIKIVRANPLKKVEIKIFRKGESLVFNPTLSKWQKGWGFLGIQFQVRFLRGNPFLAMKEAGRLTLFVSQQVLNLMGNFPTMLSRLVEGKGSPLIGPVGFVKVTTKIAHQGLAALLSLLGGLSISLAIFQLIPLPPLDGGHVLFAFLELVRGKPVDKRIILSLQTIGVTLLLILFVLVTYSDIFQPIPSL